jgi:hypothetical protein
MYVVKPKPEPDLSPTYTVNFLSPKNPKPQVWGPSLKKIRPTHLYIDFYDWPEKSVTQKMFVLTAGNEALA